MSPSRTISKKPAKTRKTDPKKRGRRKKPAKKVQMTRKKVQTIAQKMRKINSAFRPHLCLIWSDFRRFWPNCELQRRSIIRAVLIYMLDDPNCGAAAINYMPAHEILLCADPHEQGAKSFMHFHLFSRCHAVAKLRILSAFLFPFRICFASL